LEKVIEETPTGVLWHSREETRKLLSMMSDVHLEKVEAARHAKHPPIIGPAVEQ
jgi:DNA (cytosine-5)-methyltransferase 1